MTKISYITIACLSIIGYHGLLYICPDKASEKEHKREETVYSLPLTK